MRTSILVVCVLALVSASCSGSGDGDGGVAETPVTIRDVLVSGADKLASATVHDGAVTYSPSGVGETQVGRVGYRSDVSLDVYYPPGYEFDAQLPAVVFVNAWSPTAETVLVAPDGEAMQLGIEDYQNAASYISMGNLVAASGMIAIVYGTADDPVRDLDDVVVWLTANAADVGIDPARIGMWMWSAHTLVGLRAVMNEADAWSRDLGCVVVYYGWMPSEQVRADVPVQVVKALDDLPFFIESIDTFVQEAEAVGAPVEYLEVQGPHSFDRETGHEDVTASTLETTLDFLRFHLAG